MIKQNTEKDNHFLKTESDFVSAIHELGIAEMLRKSNIRKEKGHSVFSVFRFLLLMAFRGCSLFEFLRSSKKKGTAYDDNTYYRFLDNARYNWQRFLSLLSAKVIAYMDALTRPERVRCFVLDDSVIAFQRSKKRELLSWVHDHVIHKTVKGFSMLTLGWTDGFSFIPVGFNMLASAKAGKRINEAKDGVDRRSRGYRARMEAVLQKPQAAMLLIRNALEAGIHADYVLMDTWFTNEPLAKEILAEGLDVIGMLKKGNQRYFYRDRLYTVKGLTRLVSMKRGGGSILGSIVVRTKANGIPVKIIFVRNRNNRSEYITILTTDCSLSDQEAVRIYGERWNIELFFRASKSLLNLGKESQGLSYDTLVGSTSIVFTRFILLELLRRRANDQKTICELFFVCCEDVHDIEYCEALRSLMSIFMDGLKKGTIKITKEAKSQLLNWYVSQPAFIRELCPDLTWEV